MNPVLDKNSITDGGNTATLKEYQAAKKDIKLQKKDIKLQKTYLAAKNISSCKIKDFKLQK